MKKSIFCFIVLILLALGACISFYETTSYYKWTDEALNAKLVCIDNSFTLEKSATTVTANGKLMNCTNKTIEVKEDEIIVYCRDTATNELLPFKNLTSYSFAPSKEITIFIQIYKGAISTENSQHASKILEDYRIEKIEYKISENEIYNINTIAQTGSYLIPLGTIISVPIILSILVVFLILFLQYQKDKTLNLNEITKQLSTKKQTLILLLLLIIPITFLSVGTFAFFDKHWDIATYCSLSAIFGLILIGLVILIALLNIKSRRKTKIAKLLVNGNRNKNEQIEPTTYLSDKKGQIKNINYEINILKNDIANFNNNKILSEIGNVDRLDGWQFEKYCAKLFTALGYQVTVTKGSGDFGADLILDNSISVQCKLYSGSVGLHALQEVYSSMARYKTKYAWVITNSTFTKQAIEYAYDAQIKLIDRDLLKQLMIKAFNTYPEDSIKEHQAKIAELQNKIYQLSSELEEIERLNHLSYKEIKTLYKKYF